MIIKTEISAGYRPLLEIFAKANNLDLKFCVRPDPYSDLLTIAYDDESDTAMTVIFMSCRHLGFENMLADYLIKCGVEPEMLSFGKAAVKRDLKQVELDWQAHRKIKLRS